MAVSPDGKWGVGGRNGLTVRGVSLPKLYQCRPLTVVEMQEHRTTFVFVLQKSNAFGIVHVVEFALA